MNSKTAAAIFGIACVVLGLAFFWRHAKAVSEKQADDATIVQLSNKVDTVTEELSLQKQVGLKLQGELDDKTKEVATLSSALDNTKTELAKAKGDATAAADMAKAEIAKKDARIADLEAQSDAATKKLSGMSADLASLESKIADTQKKLAASEGDKKFLQDELARLQKEHAQLQKEFNDLTVLRQQVKVLTDEVREARSLAFIKSGIWGTPQKGAETLNKLNKPVTPLPTNASGSYGLTVDISRTGGVTNVTSTITNRPSGR